MKIKNKTIWIVVGIVLLIAILIIFLIFRDNSSKKVNGVVSYLENKGYTCNKGSYNVGKIDEDKKEEAIGCFYKEENIEHQYIIRNNKEFEIQYVFKENGYKDAEFSFKIAPYIISELNYIYLYKNGNKSGKFVSSSSNFINEKAILDSVCNVNDYDYEKNSEKCDDLRDYLEDVNNAINNYKKLYNDNSLEMK